ncbi:4-alpha-glucanotransferase [Monocercomonoides exilis]|uniref:4-alpha-glucanotransferase n=1 Tax=Monocercomonoides exilis TaxID=2049356 RepID=UPI003559FD08|nr:4-alpha-glucanotransferase [Monocercomonoides exilis]|eukprot:MONOS_2717.1-p1 / transcript=MONOS_2717.1 / gene=MONOS_2717 / organism=Monocercomonoides_exilis_PA203 / gene_product=4-alpha-glucanotransferase / transcript_product=4-alpha-glucanotransferase / location=Mono_scaffold00057:100015-103095(+) / protein_length=981 / sequence_SO=supercontig / SO=protein_coding / is_pseudo=false
MSKVIACFCIRYDNTRWGDNVYICGSLKELGEWNPSKAIQMVCHDSYWQAFIALDMNTKFEYKYFFKSGDYIRWEERSHFRSFDVTPGEIVEVRDLWHNKANFTEDVASSSLIQDVCMRRNKPEKLPKVERPEEEKVSVVFEVPVPLISPLESVRLIGATKQKPFWRIADSQTLYDSESPIFRGIRTFDVDELPVQYKFVLSHDLGWECENIEIGPNNECYKPTPIDITSPDTVVWTIQEDEPKAIHIAQAINTHLCRNPTAGHAQIIFIESPSFRYPNEPHFRAAGVVLPVFSLRSKQSLGIGEFADLTLLAKWCQMAGLRVIQLLPITDTTVNDISWMDSYPYSSTSSFALHPIYINIDSLKPLPADIAADLPTQREKLNKPKVDYEATLRLKMGYLERIFDFHLTHEGGFEKDPEFIQFQKDAAYWLPSYAVFKTLARQNKSTKWQNWPEELRDEANVKNIVEEMTQPTHRLYREVLFHMWVQYHLDRQLREASRRCVNECHVGLKGDIPIGVDPRSADTWYFRKYFRLDTQAGAPPDAFSTHGQNWGFPTYNWENILADNFEWWGNRLKVMSRTMHAFRIDHILGFYRIWQIPSDCKSGLHARFYPGRLVSGYELERRGLRNTFGRLTKPIITRELVYRQFGAEAEDIISTYLDPAPQGSDSDFVFKPQFPNELAIHDYVSEKRGITNSSTSDELKELDAYMKKFYALTNSVCLYEFDGGYAPRFDVASTESWKRLGGDWQAALVQLAKEYFYEWHQDIYGASARTKFPKMKEASKMLICGEDLGLLTPIIPQVMHEFNILGLRVQRMTGDPSEDYYHPKNYSEGIVATTSTHDMPPLRAWWQITNLNRPDLEEFYRSGDAQKECHVRDCFWYNTLSNHSPRPTSLPNDQLERIVDMHMYSPAMLTILPYQDLVAILPDDEVYHQNPWDEVINNPDNRKHYWQYRMPCFIERLMEKTALTDRIRGKVEDSGRLRVH